MALPGSGERWTANDGLDHIIPRCVNCFYIWINKFLKNDSRLRRYIYTNRSRWPNYLLNELSFYASFQINVNKSRMPFDSYSTWSFYSRKCWSSVRFFFCLSLGASLYAPFKNTFREGEGNKYIGCPGVGKEDAVLRLIEIETRDSWPTAGCQGWQIVVDQDPILSLSLHHGLPSTVRTLMNVQCPLCLDSSLSQTASCPLSSVIFPSTSLFTSLLLSSQNTSCPLPCVIFPSTSLSISLLLSSQTPKNVLDGNCLVYETIELDSLLKYRTQTVC